MKVNSFTVKIDNFDNAVMIDDRTGETVRIIRDLADRIAAYGLPNLDGTYLKDTNGNSIGYVSVDWSEGEQ